MYDELFLNTNRHYEYQNITDINEIKNIYNTYITKYYNSNDDKDTWFNKLKECTEELGYTSDMKAYKQNPTAYKGSVADISMVIRVVLTTKSTTPDLYEILKLLSNDQIKQRGELI